MITASYNAPGQPYLPSDVTGTTGNMSTFTYAGPGNLSATANANAATANLTYNPDGTVATATAPAGGVTTYGYNGAHQLTSVTPPPGGSLQPETRTYDGAGRLKTATTGAGVTTTYTYDGLDRPKTETRTGPLAAPNVSYAYDTAGNLTSRTDATGTSTFTYDIANRPTQKTLGGGGSLVYTYDGVGNLLTATDAGGTTTYHPNKANLVDQITEPGGRTDVFAYDADHRRTDTWDATNGAVAYDVSGNNVIPPTGFAVHIHSSFDTAGHLTQLKTTRASSDAAANRVADLTYVYTVPSGSTCAGSTVGRNTALRQSVTDNLTGAITAYCYDAGDRLTSASTSGGATYAYGYDSNGNRTSGPEGPHTFNAVNQATDASSVFDADGNLTASTSFPSMAYNGVDQASSITAAAQSPLAMTYAGTTNAERTAAGPATYQNGLLGVQTQATGGTPTTFVRDPQGALVAERVGTDEYYYVFDGLGSVIGLVDAAGVQRVVYSYDPYGDHAIATAMNGAMPPNSWRYAGGYLDSTGLYHFGARFYDPSVGRWTQQDSLVSLGDPGTANRYAYAGDDPVNRLDPTGQNDVSDFFTKDIPDFLTDPKTAEGISKGAVVISACLSGASTVGGIASFFAGPVGTAIGAGAGCIGAGVGADQALKDGVGVSPD